MRYGRRVLSDNFFSLVLPGKPVALLVAFALPISWHWSWLAVTMRTRLMTQFVAGALSPF